LFLVSGFWFLASGFWLLSNPRALARRVGLEVEEEEEM